MLCMVPMPRRLGVGSESESEISVDSHTCIFVCRGGELMLCCEHCEDMQSSKSAFLTKPFDEIPILARGLVSREPFGLPGFRELWKAC
jgi:hypothetical protein